MPFKRFGRDFARLLLAATAALAIGGRAHAFDVTTYHYDAQRTGLNATETTLTEAAVGSAAFHQLHAVALPAQVDAQPLIVSAATMSSWGYASTFPHDVAYVADEANNIFAIDSYTGAILLQKNFGTPVSVQNLPGQCGNNASTVGINSTPVIDPANKVMYFITYTWENNAAVYRIHEMNLLDLSEKIASVVITASGKLSDGSTFNFIPGTQRQRPALLLANSTIYAGFGSFCDQNDNITRGWLLGWQTGTLTPLAASELTQQQTAAQSTNNPFGNSGPFFLSTIWMSGYGPSADASGNVYFVTGNSDGIRDNNLPDSLVRMPPNLASVTDYFTPANFASLDAVDEDRGSGGVMVVPPLSNGPQFAVSQGKDGRLFLHNLAANLGGYIANGPDVPSSVNAGLCWCGPAYFIGADGKQRVVSTGGTQAQTWIVPTTASGTLTAEATAPELPSFDGQDPGFMATVSTNGTAANSAVIWGLSRSSNGQIFLQALSGTLSSGSGTIYDKAGRAWSLGSENTSTPGNQQILLNGSSAYGAYGADLTIDSTGTAWHMNTYGNWYSFTVSGWQAQQGTPNFAVPSPAGVFITPAGGGSLTDGAGNVWSFSAATASGNNEVLVNGSPAFGAWAVKIVIDTAGTMWHENAAGGWWSYNGNGGWTGQGAAPAYATPSAAGSAITPSPGGVVTDASGNVWSFSSTTAQGNNEVLVNGSPAYGAWAVKIVIDTSGRMWHFNAAGNWFVYNGNGGWTPASGPTLPPAWKPGATVSAAGRLPRLQIVPAGVWANVSGNANLVPVVANGKAYVASYDELTIWGVAN
jgi:hypothetical protein